MNTFQKILQFKYTKNILLFMLLALFARSVGERLPAVIGEPTLGNLMRTFIPCLPYIILLVLIATIDFKNIRLTLSFPEITFKQALVLILIAVFAGKLVLFMAFKTGMTENMVAFVALAGSLFSLYLALSYGVSYGLVAFFLALPFLQITEFWFQEIIPILGMVDLGPIAINPTIVLVFSLFMIGLITHIVEAKGRLFTQTPLDIPIFLFMLILFISVLTSSDFSHSLKAFLPQIALPLVFFFLVVNYIKTPKEIMILIHAIIIYVILSTFFAYYFYVRRGGLEVLDPTITYSMIYTYPVFLMGSGRMTMNLLVFPLIISLFILSKEGSKLILYGLAILFLIASIFIQQSRTGLITLLAISLVFIKNKRVAIPLLGGLILIASFWGFFLPHFFSRFEELASLESLDIYGFSRHRYWGLKVALEMVKDFPLSGIGFGMWDRYYFNYAPPIVHYLQGKPIMTYPFSAHNIYLEYAVQAGVFALLVYLYLLIAIFKQGISLIKNSPDRKNKTLALGYIGAMVGVCVAGIPGGNPLPFYEGGFIFWSIVGIFIAIGRLGIPEV